MKYRILQSFAGSPDGRFAVQYTAGQTDVELTDSLAVVALSEGWAEPMGKNSDETISTQRRARGRKA